MSSPSDDNTAHHADLPDARAVAAYLKANPAFFTAYPDVLHELDIPHASGGATSLLERQVASLRSENQRLKTRFHELVRLAESNQELITRIHQLALLLMEAAGPQAIFATLADNLMRDFKAERAEGGMLANTSVASRSVARSTRNRPRTCFPLRALPAPPYYCRSGASPGTVCS